MNLIATVGTIPSPTRPPDEFLAYEGECRTALKPALDGILDLAISAGWNRRTAASTLMFLAAQHVSASETRKPGP